jgi:branched-chain amino acid transport system permease protein
VIDQSSYYATADPAISNTVLFVVILIALLWQRRGQVSRGKDIEGGTWRAVKEIRPIPKELRSLSEVITVRRGLMGSMAVASIAFGVFGSGNAVNLGALILIFGIIGASLVILTGWAGQISLGQVAFVAVGAVVTGRLSMQGDMNVVLALLIAAFVGAIVAVVIGLPALRIQGLFLAASTLAFALFVSSMLLNPTYFGWLVPLGRLDRPRFLIWELGNARTFYLFVLAVFALVLMSIVGLRRSRTGRVLIGSRDNERAAKAFAVNVTKVRLTAFAFSGFYAAIAGGLFALHQNTVNAVSFGVEKSLDAFVMVVIGGLGSLPGALMGATFFYGTQFLLTPTLGLLFNGLGMLVVLMIYPGGIGQVLYDRRDAALRWFAKRRGILVPSLLADAAEDEEAPVEVESIPRSGIGV